MAVLYGHTELQKRLGNMSDPVSRRKEHGFGENITAFIVKAGNPMIGSVANSV
jgi:hypothetical protein